MSLILILISPYFAVRASQAAPRTASTAEQRHQLSLQLVHACEYSNDKEARRLLAKGANPNARDAAGTPVILLAMRNSKRLIEPLLRAGADVNAREPKWRTTPLMRAACYYDAATIRLLLKHGARLEARDSSGSTALSCAAFSTGGCGSASNADTGIELIKQGANVNARDFQGNTPLMSISRWIDVDGLTLTRYLITHGAQVNLKNKDGKAALKMASEEQLDDEQISKFIRLLKQAPKLSKERIAKIVKQK